jgi:hypothetical protein
VPDIPLWNKVNLRGRTPLKLEKPQNNQQQVFNGDLPCERGVQYLAFFRWVRSDRLETEQTPRFGPFQLNVAQPS